MYCIFFESILQRLYLNQKDNKSKPGSIYWRLSSGQSAEMVILLCPSMEFIYRVSSKTHFLNCRFAKPNLRVYGLSLLEGHIYPQTYFLNSRNSESAFFGTPTWCSIAIVQSAIPWLAGTMFALLVPQKM